VKTRLARIGNAGGIRLAKPLLEQAGLEDEVEVRVEPGALIITAAASPRAGWAQAVAKYGPGSLLDAPSTTRFDDDWAWYDSLQPKPVR
jgi:antitoxin MazE